MKKIATLLAGMLLFAAAAFAQTPSVTTPSQNLRLQYKGARVIGNDVELTVTITNLSSEEVVLNLVGGTYQNGMAGSVAYDNDGNIYELNNILVSVGNKSYTEQYSSTAFPSQVPVKCHVFIRGVDKAANLFSKVKLCLLCPQLDIRNTGIHFEINNVSIK